MSRFALLIEYDGSQYHGWQIQKADPTIQQHLEDAMQQLTQQSVRIIGSGRTDTGVHARGQVAHFDSPREDFTAEIYRRGLNANLPDDILVKACVSVSDDFHARFDAKRRDYQYTMTMNPRALGRQYAWSVRGSLDVTLLQQTAEFVEGTHDFTSFMSARSDIENTRCHIIKSSWKIGSKRLRYFGCGDRFLHNMVRCLVGTMVEVARGRYTMDEFRQFIDEPDKKAPVVRAPAHGLVLDKVHYPGEIFPRK
ncbi:MAG: tRNA pseudouridine synthase A [Candidatus Marinimicrobia bacterium]|nr:tRNA pseudouridine synthase A [Candidatus Neomarinimicrobiota bacterium]